MDSEIQKPLELQVAKKEQERPICVLPVGVVSKVGEKHRLILDLRWVNESIITTSFRQSDLTQLRQIGRSRDQLTKLKAKSIWASDASGKVLSIVRPFLWFGMQSAIFRQTGSGECEVPETRNSSTAHASLCGRFSTLRPIGFHFIGDPPDRRDPRVTGMEDKHERTHYPIYPRGDLHRNSAGKASQVTKGCAARSSKTRFRLA